MEILKTGKLLIVALMCGAMAAHAQPSLSTQQEKTDTRQGNKQFNKENYTEAEANYKKALDKQNNMPQAIFNLGDAVYQQKRYAEAERQFELSAQTNPDPLVKAKALYNLGNSYLSRQKWEDAVKAYKNSLKWNANDKDAKYNLAYANAMLQQSKNNQKNNQNKDQNKKDNKDNKDQNKDNKQQQNQQPPDSNKDQQANNQQQQQQKSGQQPKLSKEEAEKLLQALMNEEQKTNQKMQQKQMKAANVKIQKDW